MKWKKKTSVILFHFEETKSIQRKALYLIFNYFFFYFMNVNF